MGRDREVDRVFLRTKIFKPGKQGAYSYVTCLPDSGNRVPHALMREDIFRKLYPNGQLVPNNLCITQAESKSLMNVVGRSKDPLTVQFYDGKGGHINYHCRPTVCKDLHLPLLLGAADMIRLKMHLKLDEGVADLNVENTKLTIPLVGQKERPTTTVSSLRNYKIEPFTEVDLVGVLDCPKTPGKIIQFEPDPKFGADYGLLTKASIDKVREGNVVRFSVMNLNEFPISINKHRPLGIAIPCSVEKGRVYQDATLRSDCLARRQERAVLNIRSKKSRHDGLRSGKARPGEKPKSSISLKELRKRLYDDLELKENDLLSKEEKEVVLDLFIKYSDVLALDYRGVGDVDPKICQVEIDTGDHPPVTARMRPAPPNLKKDLREQLDRWMEQKVIAPCPKGSWSSRMCPVRKPDNTIRWAIDYRALNKITKRDARPVPNLMDRLISLKSGPKPIKFLTSLDISEAFHAIHMSKDASEKAAFITEYGLFAPLRLPFGLACGPAVYSNVMNALETALHKKQPSSIHQLLCYFDDVLSLASSFPELIQNLENILIELKHLGLKIKPSKVKVARRSMKWLGHIIDSEGIRPDPKQLEAIHTIPPPKTKKQAQSLLGFLNIFRRFIRGFAHHTHHLNQLRNQDHPVWTNEHERELQYLKDCLTKAPLLRHPEFGEGSKPFWLTTDASEHGVGATLSQVQTIKDENGKSVEREVIIAYASRSKKAGQHHYGSYKSELAAVVDGVQHFHEYLIGRRWSLRVDNFGVSWLMNVKNDNIPSLAHRWRETLAGYDFDIVWQKGLSREMRIADFMSRRAYKHDDFGNMAPAVIRDHHFPGELSENESQSMDNEVWSAYFKKRFNTEGTSSPSMTDGEMAKSTTKGSSLPPSSRRKASSLRAVSNKNRPGTKPSSRPYRVNAITVHAVTTRSKSASKRKGQLPTAQGENQQKDHNLLIPLPSSGILRAQEKTFEMGKRKHRPPPSGKMSSGTLPALPAPKDRIGKRNNGSSWPSAERVEPKAGPSRPQEDISVHQNRTGKRTRDHLRKKGKWPRAKSDHRSSSSHQRPSSKARRSSTEGRPGSSPPGSRVKKRSPTPRREDKREERKPPKPHRNSEPVENRTGRDTVSKRPRPVTNTANSRTHSGSSVRSNSTIAGCPPVKKSKNRKASEPSPRSPKPDEASRAARISSREEVKERSQEELEDLDLEQKAREKPATDCSLEDLYELGMQVFPTLDADEEVQLAEEKEANKLIKYVSQRIFAYQFQQQHGAKLAQSQKDDFVQDLLLHYKKKKEFRRDGIEIPFHSRDFKIEEVKEYFPLTEDNPEIKERNQEIRKWLRVFHQLSINLGVLCRKTEAYPEPANSRKPKGKSPVTVRQTAIPKSLRTEVLMLAHYADGNSHRGARTTYLLLRKRAYWPGMEDQCRKMVAKCPICANKRPPSRHELGKTSSLTHERNLHWSVDMAYMPMAKSKKSLLWTSVPAFVGLSLALTNEQQLFCPT